eukprot:5043265-Amphidinium_carterae.1
MASPAEPDVETSGDCEVTFNISDLSDAYTAQYAVVTEMITSAIFQWFRVNEVTTTTPILQ